MFLVLTSIFMYLRSLTPFLSLLLLLYRQTVCDWLVPLLIKGDQRLCANYGGITLLPGKLTLTLYCG